MTVEYIIVIHKVPLFAEYNMSFYNDDIKKTQMRKQTLLTALQPKSSLQIPHLMSSILSEVKRRLSAPEIGQTLPQSPFFT